MVVVMVSGSIPVSMEKRAPFFPNNAQKAEANMENGWGNATDNSTHNGWALFGRPRTLEASSNGWMDEPPTEEYNGWASLVGPSTSEASSNGWMEEPPKEEYNGWGSFGGPITSEASSTGWINEPPKEKYDGWDIPESRLTTRNTMQHTISADFIAPILQTMADELHTLVSSAPSAPPVPEEGFDEDPINVPYPSVDSSPVDFPSAFVGNEAPRLNEAKDGISTSPSACVICWDAPIEGACIPCGHMAGCMACLSEVKSKQGACPVCRAKIDQAIRIYAI